MYLGGNGALDRLHTGDDLGKTHLDGGLSDGPAEPDATDGDSCTAELDPADAATEEDTISDSGADAAPEDDAIFFFGCFFFCCCLFMSSFIAFTC